MIKPAAAALALLVLAAGCYAAEPEADDVLRQMLLPRMTAERQAQLKSLFPEASIRRDRITLSEEHLRTVEEMTEGRVLTKVVEVYEAKSGVRTLAFFSFFDAPDAAGGLSKVAVVMRPDGRIDRVVPFPRSPKDPMGDSRFLRQFGGKRASVKVDWVEGLAVRIPKGREVQLVRFARGVRAVASLIVAVKGLSASTR